MFVFRQTIVFGESKLPVVFVYFLYHKLCSTFLWISKVHYPEESALKYHTLFYLIGFKLFIFRQLQSI